MISCSNRCRDATKAIRHTVRMLMSYGLSLNETAYCNFTPLLLGITSLHYNFINDVDIWQQTGRYIGVKVLIQEGCDCTIAGDESERYAMDEHDFIEPYLDIDLSKLTPIEAAMCQGHVYALYMLLRAGVSFNHSQLRKTLIHLKQKRTPTGRMIYLTPKYNERFEQYVEKIEFFMSNPCSLLHLACCKVRQLVGEG